MAQRKFGPEDALAQTSPTADYLCAIGDNVYQIDFVEFKIRDLDSGAVLFHVERDPSIELPPLVEGDNSSRFIRYDFGAEFFNYTTIGTALSFTVGPQPVPNFRMIERHYFRDRLLKSFDFKFGFCIPGSTNSWEVIYEVPALDDALREAIISSPFESRSDSFYFVNDVLIMHNKAEYSFSPAGDAPEPASDE
eukprot:c14865_g1_i2.p2 GENE.c14865_g1_i2~~c14865_g1_i2.p2  ORF type:complete len:193 (+),score=43.83 c14865_g1_i2:160-738(+)